MERTYKAERIDVALAQAKDELGPDAVILATRHVPGRTGREARRIEVTAISAEDAVRVGLVRTASHAQTSGRRSILERTLLRAGVPSSATRAIARTFREIHGAEPANLSAARTSLTETLRREMVFAERSSCRTVALIGPTGVGKTTTIAKLATQAALVDRRPVGMVSLDQYRIGGAEQLQKYADLIGIPMEVAHDGRSLEIALRKLSAAELVFVDTAGRSPKDAVALANLAETLHSVHEPVEVQLCVPAAIREAELQAAVDRHAVLRATKLTCTKLDEAIYHGGIVAAQVASGLPLAFFTTGQRVPEDIEIASPDRLAALLCGEEVH